MKSLISILAVAVAVAFTAPALLPRLNYNE